MNRGRVETVVEELRSFRTRKPELRVFSPRSRLSRAQSRTHAVSQIPQAGPIHRLERDRGRMQNGNRNTPQQSGIFWTVDGADAIIAPRCTLRSGKFEDYWASRSSLAA